MSTMTDLRILFMGTTDFAVACLDALIEAGYKPVAAVTQPAKPKGRGYEFAKTPVGARAEELGIQVFTPPTLKNGAFAAELDEIAPDMIIVAAYGKILPPYVLEKPAMGCINVHASLLPMYRGASPVNAAVINGEKRTGVTTMYMSEGLDTGDMIFKSSTAIKPDDDAGALFDRLGQRGGKLLVKTVSAICDGTAPRIQQKGKTCYAPIITSEMCKLDFSWSTEKIVNLIRGLCPVPSAYCISNGKTVKIFSAANASDTACVGNAGDVIPDKKRLFVKTGDGVIEIIELQAEGKRRMAARDFLAGNRPTRFE